MVKKGKELTKAQQRRIKHLFAAGLSIPQMREQLDLPRRVYLGKDIITVLGFSNFEEYNAARAKLRRRTRIPAAVKEEVKRRCGEHCVLCHSTENLHLHHIEGYTKGGPDSADNLLLMCRRCHRSIDWGNLEDLRKYQLVLQERNIESQVKYCQSCGHNHIKILEEIP